MSLTARMALFLVVILVVVSAYLRLVHSGIGCADWPGCYGKIGLAPVIDESLSAEAAYERIVAQADQPLAWATPLHRLVASLLGLLVLFLNLIAMRARQHRLVCLALLFLTVFLALLGIKSGGLHNPAVVMGNLAGGFCMLGLLGWLVFETGSRPLGSADLPIRRWSLLAIIVLGSQVLLGGLTSANFAATACQTLPDCQGGWWPDTGLVTAMDLSREHQVNAQGMAVGGTERAAIHKAHRLGAVLSLVVLLIVGLRSLWAGPRLRLTASIILVLAILEFSVGIAAILTRLPIVLAVAHNWLAGMLLLSLLKLMSLNKEAP